MLLALDPHMFRTTPLLDGLIGVRRERASARDGYHDRPIVSLATGVRPLQVRAWASMALAERMPSSSTALESLRSDSARASCMVPIIMA